MKTKTFARAILFSTLFMCAAASAFAQPQNSNWVFGLNHGLDFNSGTPTLFGSQCVPLNTSQPAVISDSDGNLVCYTDGDKVYNASDNVIQNGDLSLAPENLIVPAPGQPDKYYLLRSAGNEFTYTLIDMSLNGGSGGIVPGNVDVNIADVYCQITATVHPNGTDIWIITSDNFNGDTDDIRYTSYLLTADGITETSSIANYYLFGGWYTTPDDLRISPDCSKLATTYKGHYLVLCRFDNETGELYDLLESNIDMQTSFGSSDLDQIEFSPNSNLLYTLGDQYVIKQYDLENWNATSIANTVNPITNLVFSDVWTDIKLGPDGVLYLHNVLNGQIDVIQNPDDNADLITIEEGVIPNIELAHFFPNTANFLCGTILDISVEYLYDCIGDSTLLWYNLFQVPDSVAWNFGDPSSGANNFSTLDTTIHVFSAPGDYIVVFDYFLDSVQYTIEQPVTIYDYPTVDLPDNVLSCIGTFNVLNAGTNALTYLWSTGETSQAIEITGAGPYSVEVFNGVCSASDSTYVELIPSVDINMQTNYLLCEGETLVLDLTDSGANEYTWTNGSTEAVLEVTEAGVYTVMVNNECSAETEAFIVDFAEFPEVLLPEDIVICTIDPVILEVPYSGPGEVIWNTGSSANSIIVWESGSFSVSITEGECEAYDEINVAIYEYVPLLDLEMPNIFTPDGNNKNELFRPFLKSNPEFEICSFGGLEVDMNIYDRWGNLIEEGVCSWSGKLSGGEISEDAVFYYILDIRSQCNTADDEVKKEGYVHVLRE